MTEVKSGDWVRITIEGPWALDNYTLEDIKALDMIGIMPEDTVTVEKIEPPVEVFKPGDVVRHKGTGTLYALTDDGGSVWLGSDGAGRAFGSIDSPSLGFTSEYWERVELG